MENINTESNCTPPVRIHFSSNFPIETRCLTENDEYAVMEILKVEYDLEEADPYYDVTFFVSGIKSFSMSDDSQECFVRWNLKKYGTNDIIASGSCSSGPIEMGERFNESRCVAYNIPEGDYTFEIEYV